MKERMDERWGRVQALVPGESKEVIICTLEQ